MVSSYSGVFDAPKHFSHQSYKSEYLAQKESKFWYFVFGVELVEHIQVNLIALAPSAVCCSSIRNSFL